ncbi:hypothetical protein G7Y79_00013g034920 [Physcia stellaris]|nr:hypothetical protein G7Y79_00013g034920 [Physcia stellaris]
MFDFLGLPREIRDEIYKLCLVREKIEFEEFYTDETPEEWMKDRRPDALTLHIAKPDETPLLVYQGVPFVHRVESLTPIDGRSRWDDIYDKDPFLGDRTERVRTYINNISLCIGYVFRFLPILTANDIDLSYGIHLPTMKRLGHSLRRLMTLNELSIVLQEQSPTEKTLKSLLQKQGYVDMIEWPSPVETIPIRQCLKVGIENGDDIEDKQFISGILAYCISKGFSWSMAYDARFVSSDILVEGKKMTSSIFTYSVRKDGSESGVNSTQHSLTSSRG